MPRVAILTGSQSDVPVLEPCLQTLGDTLTEARAKAYRNVQYVHFSRRHYRRDIAAPAQEARVQ